MKNYIIAEQQLTFLDSRFYFTESGEFVPSVTTILEAYPKGAQYYEWLKKHGEDADNIRDEAGRRGSVVHQLTEQYDHGEEVTLLDAEGNIGYKLSEWAMFERYVEFRKRFPFEVLNNEIKIVSSALGFAGTIDRVINLNGENILLDIKTSGGIWSSYWLQLAAYEQLCAEQGIKIDKKAILWLNAKTRGEGKKDAIQGAGWQMIFADDDKWPLFQATQSLWEAENAGSKPKKVSYFLSHKL